MANIKNTTVDDTGFVKLPAGTTAQRPTGAAGQLRLNTTTNKSELYNGESNNWAGVSNQGVLATGGDAVYDINSEGSNYRVHVFTNPGTLNVSRRGEVEYLIIGGGGGGSGNYYDDGGGGGAGGLIRGKTDLTATGYSIAIGNGGSVSGGTGGNTTALGLTALGGGGGGGHRYSGNAGGSGGGGTGYYGNDGRPYAGGAATQPGSASGGLGNPGGGYAAGEIGGTVMYPQSSGGGGAGSPGYRPLTSGNDGENGNGGDGVLSTISGTPYYYAAGGGGVRSGKGGLGGGADSSYGRGGSPARPGADGTGSGGGGGRVSDGAAGGYPSNGGKGIVIVRYPLGSDSPVSPNIKDVNLDPVIDFDFGRVTTYPNYSYTNGGSSGTQIRDTRGTGVVGNLVNAPPYYERGSIRGCLNFNGSNQYIQIDNFSELTKPTTQLTCEGWVRPTRAVTTGTRRGAFWSNSSSTYIGIFDSNDGGATHGLHWALQTSNSRTGGNNGSIPNNQYSHIVGTYDGSRTKGYVNGVLVYDVAQTGTIANSTWYCGVYANAINDTTHNWEGDMAHLKLYTRALTAQEILDTYTNNRWRFGV